jgi:hypothetical protein
MRPARAAIFLVVLGVHVLAVLYIAMRREELPDSGDHGFSTTVFFIEDKPRRRPIQVTKSRQLSALAATAARRRSQASPAAPISEFPKLDAMAPAAIDWAKEAEGAALDTLEAEARARRRASGPSTGAGPTVGAAVAAVHQPFRWDYAQTHRVEQLAGGGLIINVSDRCALVLRFPSLLGGCKIGKIESHGDLFAHMHDQ